MSIPAGVLLIDAASSYVPVGFNSRAHLRDPKTHHVAGTCAMPEADIRPDLPIGYDPPAAGVRSLPCSFNMPVGLGAATTYDWSFDYAYRTAQEHACSGTVALGSSTIIQPVNGACVTRVDRSKPRRPGLCHEV